MKARSLVLDSGAMLNAASRDYWLRRYQEYNSSKRHFIKTRFERVRDSNLDNQSLGDQRLKRVEAIFHHGMGIKWSEVQLRIFKAFIDACLPKIYGTEWAEHKVRVLRERGISRLNQETLVNMARRNGKTFVTSGTAAALFLGIPDMQIAVFSVGERQAKMLMEATQEKINKAFELGTHISAQGFTQIQKNKEMLVMGHPEGGKQVLGCYPGSVRVSASR